MSDTQEINKLRNDVGVLMHDLDVARTQLQLLRQLNERLQEASTSTPCICPKCGTLVYPKRTTP